MDLLGDIVEHNTEAPVAPSFPFISGPSSTSGFPKPTAKKPSRWRQRLQNKGLSSMSGVIETENNNTPSQKFYTVDKDTNLRKFKDKNEKKLDYSGLSESEQIHQENIEILTKMSIEEREEAKEQLLDSLDPKILEMLMKRSSRKYGPPSSNEKFENDSLFQPVEGSIGTWVGGQHDLDTDQPSNYSNTNSLTSTNSGPLKSAFKSTSDSVSSSSILLSSSPTSSSNTNTNTNTTTTTTSNNNDGKKLRFSKEAKVIYLDQSQKVKQQTPVDSDNEWEDFKEVTELSPSPPPKMTDDDHIPSIDEVIKINDTKVEDLINSQTSSGIHFPKRSQPYEELDINDPKFNDKLYEKYFPDLPKNPKQLEWMKSVDTPIPSEIQYDSIESVRFDFKGNIITSENISNYLNDNQGLFNHAKNPELPGYTIPELAHYLRSTYPGQVCIACRTLGRILYKLGTLDYHVHEIDDSNNDNQEFNNKGTEGQFEIECWKLISNLQIIGFLQKYSSDSEKNLSVKNYAIDALWLWKNANGDAKLKKYSQSENDL
jgi:hypothetical protein